MKMTLREALNYLFEAVAPVGSFKINDRIKLSVSTNEKKLTSFSLRRADIATDEPNREEIKKIASLVSSYIIKYRIKYASVSLGVSSEGLKASGVIEKYFHSKYPEDYEASLNATNGILTVERLKKTRGEKAPKEERDPSTSKKRIPKEFVDDGTENIGVKRLYKVEKDADGNTIKEFTRMFPKRATVRKLVMTLKRKGGGTVEVYNYTTRRDAGMLKKKVSWREKQYKNELDDQESIRTVSAKDAEGKRQEYMNLKRELRKRAAAGIKNALVEPQKGISAEMDKYIRSSVNSVVGRFEVMTSWGEYSEEDKKIAINKVIKEVRYKFSEDFYKQHKKSPTKTTQESKADLENVDKKYRKIVGILMKRDKTTKAEALDRVKEAEREVKKYLDRNLINAAERRFEQLIGLDPEYLYDLF